MNAIFKDLVQQNKRNLAEIKQDFKEDPFSPFPYVKSLLFVGVLMPISIYMYFHATHQYNKTVKAYDKFFPTHDENIFYLQHNENFMSYLITPEKKVFCYMTDTKNAIIALGVKEAFTLIEESKNDLNIMGDISKSLQNPMSVEKILEIFNQYDLTQAAELKNTLDIYHEQKVLDNVIQAPVKTKVLKHNSGKI